MEKHGESNKLNINKSRIVFSLNMKQVDKQEAHWILGVLSSFNDSNQGQQPFVSMVEYTCKNSIIIKGPNGGLAIGMIFKFLMIHTYLVMRISMLYRRLWTAWN